MDRNLNEIASFQIVNQSFDRNAYSLKNGRATDDLRNNAYRRLFKLFLAD
jgi:hypothetical protein